ncbi:hypothetical protein LTR37_004357 [Vermiconidia calcicola]|uniref:Uncharacterized protein n=1 Tax=Vermiconidia calcicola TaxID=1690605 RepID=A0ACC3NP01_9PEZI|nr:hypothetical protein LTR37_004357 [Vermiconidia calcicola]
MEVPPLAVVPGHSLGPLHLGASLHEVLTIIKESKTRFPQIDFHYDRNNPLTIPVAVTLPQNGFRLRFDGADQRLRIIEIMDFKKIRLAYKGSELVKNSSTDAGGPAFKRIYQIFGASYPGEYVPPNKGSAMGTYVLSWAGIAFTFPLQHAAWAPHKDHVSMLGSSAAAPATVMALFEGNSWPEARKELFVKTPSGPRSSALATRPRDNLPAEIELANVHGNGRVEFKRRPPAATFSVVLNQTTPQDLVTELGAPDATHKRDGDALPAAEQQPAHRRASSMSNGRAHHSGSGPSSYSSTGTDTFDADFDSGDADEDPSDRASRETFWCYFNHGMDILVGPPSEESSHPTTAANGQTPLLSSPHLVVTKVIIHGNVPGSYAFNRHRRLRWTLSLPNIPAYVSPGDLSSETKFESDLKPTLLQHFAGTWPESEMGRGKVVNRTWGGGSPSESGFFLPDAEQDLVEGGGSEQWLGNTRLFAFPGLGFEVLENGAVGALTVY